MKYFLLLIFPFLLITNLFAQDNFFPAKEGIELTYDSYDAKGKLLNVLDYSIRKVKTEGDKLEITYDSQLKSAKKRTLMEMYHAIIQQDDKVAFDMNLFLLLESDIYPKKGRLSGGYFISNEKMEIPLNLKVGDKLPELNVVRSNPQASMVIGTPSSIPNYIVMERETVSLMGKTVSMSVLNGKVEAIEDVAVPAGTYSCYKVSFDVSIDNSGKVSKSSHVYWFAKEVGMVKMEILKGENVFSTMQLTQIKNL